MTEMELEIKLKFNTGVDLQPDYHKYEAVRLHIQKLLLEELPKLDGWPSATPIVTLRHIYPNRKPSQNHDYDDFVGFGGTSDY